jgi:hypothetical protein
MADVLDILSRIEQQNLAILSAIAPRPMRKYRCLHSSTGLPAIEILAQPH